MDETTIDRAAMGRLAKALEFILGADDPTTAALRKASDSGAERDIIDGGVMSFDDESALGQKTGLGSHTLIHFRLSKSKGEKENGRVLNSPTFAFSLSNLEPFPFSLFFL